MATCRHDGSDLPAGWRGSRQGERPPVVAGMPAMNLDRSPPSTKRLTAVDALRTLPAVFDLRDVEVYLGMERKVASHYCWRWHEKMLVDSLGPRTGVFYNLIVDPTGPSTRIEEALYKLLRRPPVAIGATTLHWHGWTTQRPHRRELAVITSRHLRSLPEEIGRAHV